MFDWQPLILSLEVATAAALFAFITGLGAARVLSRHAFPGRDLLEAIFLLPLVLPPVVTGFALLVLFGRYGIAGRFLQDHFHFQIIFTPYAAVVASAVVAFPLMYQSAKAALQSVDSSLEQAASSLGNSPWRVFLSITMPLAWPGLFAGALLSFARALGEFGATIMVAGNIPGVTTTAPVAIYDAAEDNDLATAGRYVLVLALFNFVLVYFLNVYVRRRHAWRGGDGS